MVRLVAGEDGMDMSRAPCIGRSVARFLCFGGGQVSNHFACELVPENTSSILCDGIIGTFSGRLSE